MSHARALAFLLAASAALAASCASVHDDEAGSPPTQAPDLTISDAARHAHFSFHEDNGAFVSAHRSFVARVDA